MISATNFAGLADDYFPTTFPEIVLINPDGTAITVQSVYSKVFSICFAVWATVACALILTFIIIYFTTIRELRDAKRLRDNVYLSDKIRSPAVYGVFRPRIILPVGYSEENIEYVLLHENSHIRHADNLWRILGFITAALHWFDPFSWLFLKVALSDLELACDERASERLDAEGRKRYAEALVDSCRPKNVFVSSFGGAKLRTRVETILSYKKITVLSSAGFALLIAAVAYLLLTNAG